MLIVNLQLIFKNYWNFMIDFKFSINFVLLFFTLILTFELMLKLILVQFLLARRYASGGNSRRMSDSVCLSHVVIALKRLLHIADLFELILYCVYSTQADRHVSLDESVNYIISS